MAKIHNYSSIHNDELRSLQRKLLHKSEEAREERRKFLALVLNTNSSAFCDYFLDLGIEETSQADFTIGFSKLDLLKPTWHTECMLWNKLKELETNLASQPGFWTLLYIRSIISGKLTPSDLATETRNLSRTGSGKHRVTQALKENDENETLSCIRRIFRVLGGEFRRGHRSTFIDCPLARCWWRHKISYEAVVILGKYELLEQFSDSLSKTFFWEPLIEHMVSKQTIISYPKVLAVLVYEISDRLVSGYSENIAGIRNSLRLVGGICQDRLLETLDIDEIAMILFEKQI